MADKSILESKRVRYLLGLSFPAEREQIEAEYFADDDAFQEMLTAEDDLTDAYARGELKGEERRRFEKRLGSSLNGRDRVQFARAFAGAVCATAPVEPRLDLTFPHVLKTFRSAGLLRTTTIAAVLVFVAVLAWQVLERRRMSNELRELRAVSAELNKRTDELQPRNDTELTRNTQLVGQLTDQQAQHDKRRRPEHGTSTIQRARRLPAQGVAQGENFENRKITVLPLVASNVTNLLTLQPAATRDGYVSGERADQSNITLDGVSLDAPYLSTSQKASGASTIRGTVKDPNGNIVSGATVTLTNSAKNITRTESTDKDGAYVFNDIPPSTYSIVVKAPGFKTAAVLDMVARFVGPTVMDVQLEVGAVTEQVEVSSASAELLVSREDGTLGSTFERKLITQLPLEAKDVPGLLALQTGTLTDSSPQTISLKRDPPENFEVIVGRVEAPQPSSIRFELTLERAATHTDYRFTVKTADGRLVTTRSWFESLTPDKTIITTPLIPAADLPPGDYVLLLMGKEPDGSFVKVAEYSFQIIK